MKERTHPPACTPQDHADQPAPQWNVSDAALERCARIFRAMGESSRLRLVARLVHGPACVSELAEREGETVATISQRLRVLRADNIVTRRRNGKHILYSLADQHMVELVLNGLEHAAHPASPASASSKSPERNTMTIEHLVHANHPHQHGTDCGHTGIQHNDHVDFLHDGHLHHPHDGHVDEHTLDVNAANPAVCTGGHPCNGHAADHVHGTDCGHQAVPHGDHIDYLVEGHLHHQHAGHCDNHGNVTTVQ